MNLGSASRKTDLSKYIRANRADSRWNGEMPFSETLKIDVGGSGALSHYRMLLTIPISPTREPFTQQDAKSPSIHSATALRVYPHCSPIPPPMPTSPHPTSIPILPHPTPPPVRYSPARFPPGDWRRNFARERQLGRWVPGVNGPVVFVRTVWLLLKELWGHHEPFTYLLPKQWTWCHIHKPHLWFWGWIGCHW